jgi:hypothetical protein
MILEEKKLHEKPLDIALENCTQDANYVYSRTHFISFIHIET